MQKRKPLDHLVFYCFVFTCACCYCGIFVSLRTLPTLVHLSGFVPKFITKETKFVTNQSYLNLGHPRIQLLIIYLEVQQMNQYKSQQYKNHLQSSHNISDFRARGKQLNNILPSIKTELGGIYLLSIKVTKIFSLKISQSVGRTKLRVLVA